MLISVIIIGFLFEGTPLMETLSSSVSMPFPREPANYDETAMHQSLLFSESLKAFFCPFYILFDC